MIYTAHHPSPVGDLLLAEQDGALIGLWLKGQKAFPNTPKDEIQDKETPLLGRTKEWLALYFDGKKPAISSLPLKPSGSEFRQAVWQILCDISYGETTTYGEIAKEMALRTGKEKMSAQAVGGAVGHNPIAIIIPCHRVVGTNGSLTGYAGGMAAKVKLLTHEGVNMENLFIPVKKPPVKTPEG